MGHIKSLAQEYAMEDYAEGVDMIEGTALTPDRIYDIMEDSAFSPAELISVFEVAYEKEYLSQD